MVTARRSECPWPGGADIPSRVRDGACRPREHADLAGPDRSPPEHSGTHAQEEHADHGIRRAEGLRPERVIPRFDGAAPQEALVVAPRRRGTHHPDPRPQGARGRGEGPARQARPHQPGQVPGDRLPGARRARPGEDGHVAGGRRALRTAQAPRRRRHDPREDCCARHVADPAARGRPGREPRRAPDAP